MTERTYGPLKQSLAEMEQLSKAEKDMATHIRELQAENAKLKAERRDFKDASQSERTYGPHERTLQNIEDLNGVVGSIPVLAMAAHIREMQAELLRLNAEWREFGINIAKACYVETHDWEWCDMDKLKDIVKQELAK